MVSCTFQENSRWGKGIHGRHINSTRRITPIQDQKQSTTSWQAFKTIFSHKDCQYYIFSKGTRQDLQEAVELLTTRVKVTDMGNYKNIGLVIKYLMGEPETPHNLEADITHIKLVGWHVILHATRYKNPYGRHNVSWQGLNILHISKKEDQHKNLYLSWSGGI